MNKCFRLVAIGLSFISFGATGSTYDDYQLQLVRGDARARSTGSFSNQVIANEMVKARIFPSGFTNMGSGNIYYLVGRGDDISQYDAEAGKYVTSWPLARTQSDLRPEIMALSAVAAGEQGERDYLFEIGANNRAVLGCLWDYPLRYGDLDRDGTSEVVLLLGKDALDEVDRKLDFVVFSLMTKSVIFSIRVAREDIGFAPDVRVGPQLNAGYPQRKSMVDARSDLNPAARAYAKLFFGDFNADQSMDIVAWRKYYEARSLADSVKGFFLKNELLTHYDLSGGAFSERSTDETTIREWLAEHQLSWTDGYPSVSECAGEEGALMPEMHDPLLNDPDVLE